MSFISIVEDIREKLDKIDDDLSILGTILEPYMGDKKMSCYIDTIISRPNQDKNKNMYCIYSKLFSNKKRKIKQECSKCEFSILTATKINLVIEYKHKDGFNIDKYNNIIKAIIRGINDKYKIKITSCKLQPK